MAILNDVSDTALWVAVYRDRETKRPNALFKDPYAGMLAGERGLNIENQMTNSKYVEWSVILRTLIIDRFLEQVIGEGADMVINLGAGLDTRPYRMQLPSSLKWVEVDFPQIINHKNERLAKLKPVCQLERIIADLSNDQVRRETLAKLNAKTRNAVVITEGVIPYLSNDSVAALGRDLHGQPNFKHWIAEYHARELMKYLKHKRKRREMQNAPFQFDPPDYLEFFKAIGWKKSIMTFLKEEADRHNRPVPHSLWVRTMMKLFMSKERRKLADHFSAYVMFERV